MFSPLNQFAIANRTMFWDVSAKSLEDMNDTAIVERVWCYGTWEQYKYVESLIGKNRAKEIFIKRAYMPRTNLREETIHLFTHYFHVTPPSDRSLSRAM